MNSVTCQASESRIRRVRGPASRVAAAGARGCSPQITAAASAGISQSASAPRQASPRISRSGSVAPAAVAAPRHSVIV